MGHSRPTITNTKHRDELQKLYPEIFTSKFLSQIESVWTTGFKPFPHILRQTLPIEGLLKSVVNPQTAEEFETRVEAMLDEINQPHTISGLLPGFYKDINLLLLNHYKANYRTAGMKREVSTFYISADLSNLGGLNKFLERHSDDREYADKVLGLVGDIFRETIGSLKSGPGVPETSSPNPTGIPQQSVSSYRYVVTSHDSGDEFSALIVGASEKEVAAKITQVEFQINNLLNGVLGLGEVEHPKYPNDPDRKGVRLGCGYCSLPADDTDESITSSIDVIKKRVRELDPPVSPQDPRLVRSHETKNWPYMDQIQYWMEFLIDHSKLEQAKAATAEMSQGLTREEVMQRIDDMIEHRQASLNEILAEANIQSEPVLYMSAFEDIALPQDVALLPHERRNVQAQRYMDSFASEARKEVIRQLLAVQNAAKRMTGFNGTRHAASFYIDSLDDVAESLVHIRDNDTPVFAIGAKMNGFKNLNEAVGHSMCNRFFGQMTLVAEKALTESLEGAGITVTDDNVMNLYPNASGNTAYFLLRNISGENAIKAANAVDEAIRSYVDNEPKLAMIHDRREAAKPGATAQGSLTAILENSERELVKEAMVKDAEYGFIEQQYMGPHSGRAIKGNNDRPKGTGTLRPF